MASIGRVHWLAFTSTSNASSFPPKRRRFLPPFLAPKTPNVTVSALTTPPSVGENVEEEVLQAFYRDRELNGDFITKVSNTIFWRQASNTSVVESDSLQPSEEVDYEESEGGFLKLAATKEWLMGENDAPINKKIALKEMQDDRERRKKLNFLMYEAAVALALLAVFSLCLTYMQHCVSTTIIHDFLKLKKELLLLTVSIGAACSGYCLVVFSLQAAVSYAAGVAFSCLYFQLLCQHSDKISRDAVPEIFRKRKVKKIGIRSQDLQDTFERTIRGSGMALSSPRLVIPGAIFGLWGLFHQYSTNDFFDFQLVPAMLGLFAYKAAALVQVYRDNEDLKLIFPQDEENFY